jgi:hypothetical protein
LLVQPDVRIDLTREELVLLRTALDRALVEYEHELVRTDVHELQHGLGVDIDRLIALRDRLAEPG